MRCPKCQTEMDSGRVEIRATFGGFLLFGLSWKHLVFREARTNAEHRVVHNSHARGAYHCPACTVVVLDTDIVR